MSESDVPLTDQALRRTWVDGLQRVLGLDRSDSDDLSDLPMDDLHGLGALEEPPPLRGGHPKLRRQLLDPRIARARVERVGTPPPRRAGVRLTFQELQQALTEAVQGIDHDLDTGDPGELNGRLDAVEVLLGEIDGLTEAVVEKASLIGVIDTLLLELDDVAIASPEWVQIQYNRVRGVVGRASAVNTEALALTDHRDRVAAADDAVTGWRVQVAKRDDFLRGAAYEARAKRLATAADVGDRAVDEVTATAIVTWQAWRDGALGATPAGAKSLLDLAEAGLLAAESARRAHAIGAMDGVKPKRSRKALMALVEDDPGLLANLASSPEGRAAMDDLVAGYGDTIKKKGDRAFITELMKARFGLRELKGDLTQKGLPRLYQIFVMVPDSHTLENPALLEVERRRNFNPTSWYGESADTDEGMGPFHMVLQGARTGGVLGWAADTLSGLHGTSRYREVKGKKAMNALNAVTLHEIGHAVDTKETWMDRNGKLPQYGGWKKETVDSVAKAAHQGHKLAAAFPTLPADLVVRWLWGALGKGFNLKAEIEPYASIEGIDTAALEADPGVVATIDWQRNPDNLQLEGRALKAEKKRLKKLVTARKGAGDVAREAIDHALTHMVSPLRPLRVAQNAQVLPGTDWKALRKHAVWSWCASVQMSGGESGLWEDGAKSKKSALGGRIYQECYSGDWISYAETAREKRVTNYQFRSDSEWFADAYSVYYSGKLPDSHPLKPWLDEQTPYDRRPG